MCSGLCVEYLWLTVDDSSRTGQNLYSLSGISSFADSLSKLVIRYQIDLTDFSDVAYLTNLNSLTIYGCSLSGLSTISSLTDLTYLDLRNNAIYDTAEDDDGNSYNNLEILIRLNSSYTGADTLNGSLSTLYISGNKLTLDSTNSAYTTLLGLTWAAKDF